MTGKSLNCWSISVAIETLHTTLHGVGKPILGQLKFQFAN